MYSLDTIFPVWIECINKIKYSLAPGLEIF